MSEEGTQSGGTARVSSRLVSYRRAIALSSIHIIVTTSSLNISDGQQKVSFRASHRLPSRPGSRPRKSLSYSLPSLLLLFALRALARSLLSGCAVGISRKPGCSAFPPLSPSFTPSTLCTLSGYNLRGSLCSQHLFLLYLTSKIPYPTLGDFNSFSNYLFHSFIYLYYIYPNRLALCHKIQKRKT